VQINYFCARGDSRRRLPRGQNLTNKQGSHAPPPPGPARARLARIRRFRSHPPFSSAKGPMRQIEMAAQLPSALDARGRAEGLGMLQHVDGACVAQEADALDDLRRAQAAQRQGLLGVAEVEPTDKRVPASPGGDGNLDLRIGLGQVDQVLLEVLPAQVEKKRGTHTHTHIARTPEKDMHARTHKRNARIRSEC
jgi:hypothetical protein